MNNLSIKLTFSLDSPIHITGDRISRGVNKSMCIRKLLNNEIHIIPATTIKGVLRSALEYLLRKSEEIEYLLRKSEEICFDQNCGICLACEFFGHPGKESPLIFQDAKLNGEIMIRPGVRIDRRRKVALDRHLFSVEVVGGDTFQTEIKGFFESYEKALKACAVIWIAAKFCKGFGAGRSYGLGWSRLKTFDAEIDDKTIALAAIEQKAREVFQ